MSSIAVIQNKFNNCSVKCIGTCIKNNSKCVNWQSGGNAIFVSVDCFAKKCGMSGKRCDEIIFHEVKKNNTTKLHIFLIEKKGHSRESEGAIKQLQASAQYMEKRIKKIDYHAFQPVISCKRISTLRRNLMRNLTKISMHDRVPKAALVVNKKDKFFDKL